MNKVIEFLNANPEIEISVSSSEYAWIRLHGKAVFENNMAVKVCGAILVSLRYYGTSWCLLFL